MNAAETKKIGHAYVALGSNLENPILQVQQAIEALKGLRGTCLVGQSSLYRSAPIGRLDQSDFINAVAYIETTLSPHCLLQALLEIELHQGRVRESLNAPRTLDLDILLYDNLQYRDENLTIPHPRMSQRAFVLQPLTEIAPHCWIPGQGLAADLLPLCFNQRLEKIHP